MTQDRESSVYEPMHIVHGRTSGLLTAVLWGMRAMTVTSMTLSIIKSANALLGISEEAPHLHVFACCCFTSLFVFMVVKSMTGLLNDATEVLVCSWVFIFVALGCSVWALWSMSELPLSTATLAVMVFPQGVTVNIVLQSYLELCGTIGAPKLARFVMWIFTNAIAALVCVSGPGLTHLAIPVVVGWGLS